MPEPLPVFCDSKKQLMQVRPVVLFQTESYMERARGNSSSPAAPVSSHEVSIPSTRISRFRVDCEMNCINRQASYNYHDHHNRISFRVPLLRDSNRTYTLARCVGGPVAWKRTGHRRGALYITVAKSNSKGRVPASFAFASPPSSNLWLNLVQLRTHISLLFTFDSNACTTPQSKNGCFRPFLPPRG
jgi:hypothetical protein